MNKHNYEEVFEDFRDQLLEIPEHILNATYAFRDFCEEHFICDYEKQMEFKFEMEVGPKSFDRVKLNYLVVVKSKWYTTGYQETGYQQKGHKLGSLTIEVQHPLLNNLPRGFKTRRNPKELKWDPVQEVLDKLDKK